MSELQKELEKIANQLQSIPQALRQQRTELASKAEVAVEMANKGSVLDGLQTPYYEAITEYAKQRATIIENSTSRLEFWNISDPSVWNQSWATQFTFPSTTVVIVYAFLDDGTPVQFNDNDYYIIEADPGVIAKQTNVGLFIRGPETWTIPDYTTDVINVKGDDHVRLTFSTALAEAPDTGENWALISRSTDTLVGRLEVGIEGLDVNPNWSSTDPTVNVSNQGELDAWFESMLEVSNTDFTDLTGQFLNGTLPEDDVVLSADPTVRSESSEPYTDAKLYASPFYPALNTNENDWPEDFDSIDLENRKLTVDGVDQWGVYPQFRWEGKLIPALAANPDSEELPTTFYIVQKVNDLLAINLSQTDFPVNDPVVSPGTYTEYFWQQSDDKVYGQEVTDDGAGNTTTDTPFIVDCTYNSVTDKIDSYNNNLESALDTLETLLTGYTNPFDASAASDDSAFLTIVQAVRSHFADVLAHHSTWFAPADDGDVSKFDSDFGVYDQTNINTFETYLTNNSSVWEDRVTDIENLIGSSKSRTGYAGEVVNSVDALVNRNFGFFADLITLSNRLNTVKETLKKQRQKYDVYSA